MGKEITRKVGNEFGEISGKAKILKRKENEILFVKQRHCFRFSWFIIQTKWVYSLFFIFNILQKIMLTSCSHASLYFSFFWVFLLFIYNSKNSETLKFII